MKTEAERLRAEARRQNDTAQYYCDLMLKYQGERDEAKKENTKLHKQLETACMLLAVNVGNIDKVKDGGAITINKTKANKDANSWLEFIRGEEK
jgi:hypothetical protein